MSTDPTKTDPTAHEWAITDDVVRLREWGTGRIYSLPASSTSEVIIGADDTCDVRLVDGSGRTSRRHAALVRDGSRWTLRDLDSKNGVQLDGAYRRSFDLEPGSEIGIGDLILIAESSRSVALRCYLARILGWASDRTHAVDLALRAVRSAVTRRTALVVCAESNPVSIAIAVHRIAVGRERPFVTCDPRRTSTTETVRWAQNCAASQDALTAASGGTLCVWSSRLPSDFAAVRARLHEPGASTMLAVCANKPIEGDALMAAPITVLPLRDRSNELSRIVDEYADDAIAELAASGASFTNAEREWVVTHAASTLNEIETATLRLVALREFANVNRAATRLGMAHVSLARWIERRKVPLRP
jgi:Inner membrane component of T3SS, cytoplasmic domain